MKSSEARKVNLKGKVMKRRFLILKCFSVSFVFAVFGTQSIAQHVYCDTVDLVGTELVLGNGNVLMYGSCGGGELHRITAVGYKSPRGNASLWCAGSESAGFHDNGFVRYCIAPRIYVGLLDADGNSWSCSEDDTLRFSRNGYFAGCD